MENIDLRECEKKLDGDLENWAYSYFAYGLLERTQTQGIRVTRSGSILASSLESAKALLDNQFLLESWRAWEHYEGTGTLPGFWIIRKDSSVNSSYIMLYWGAERWAKYAIDCVNQGVV